MKNIDFLFLKFGKYAQENKEKYIKKNLSDAFQHF